MSRSNYVIPHTFSLDAADPYCASFFYDIWSHAGKLINVSNLLFALLLNCESVIVAPQAPLSMGFTRQEYWSGLPFSSPGDLPDPGIEPWSPALRANSLLSEPQGSPLDPYDSYNPFCSF